MNDAHADARAFLRDTLHLYGLFPQAHLDDLATRVLGRNYLRRAPIATETEMRRDGRKMTMIVREGLGRERAEWARAHRFADWLLRCDGRREDDVLRLRSLLAAELLLPDAHMARGLRVGSARDVAIALGAPRLATEARAGQVLERPVVIGIPGAWCRDFANDDGRLPRAGELAHFDALATLPLVGVERDEVCENGRRAVVLRLAS